MRKEETAGTLQREEAMKFTQRLTKNLGQTEKIRRKEERIDQPQRDQAGFGPPESFGSSLGFSAELSSMDFTPPLKFLMAFPSPDPISGRRFAPKMRKIIARIMISS